MNIEYFYFQPFPSRAGRDEVIGLRFTYDGALVAALKACLAPLHATVRNRAVGIHCAGGWQPDARCWFVEWEAWPDVRELLTRRLGHRLEHQPRPPDVPHYDASPAPGPTPRAPAHDLPACLAAIRTAYPAFAALGLLPEAEDVVQRAAYRALAQQHHPDRGGDPSRMIALNQAWETLQGVAS